MNSSTKLEPRTINNVNWIGLCTLIKKETSRFLTVYTQTLVAPVITTVLFYLVFEIAFSSARGQVMGVSFMNFLVPGLIMMGMAQNAFANTSSTLTIGKIQGSITDIIMAPLSPMEMLVGYVTGGIIRGLLVGTISAITFILLMGMQIVNFQMIVIFSFLGTMMLSLLGLMG